MSKRDIDWSAGWRLPVGDRHPATPASANAVSTAGLHVDLATAQASAGRSFAEVPDPFVTLGDKGRFSRTVLARVTGPSGGIVREVALEIQSDEYSHVQGSGWSNRDVERHWEQKWRLWNAAAAAGAAPRVLDVLPLAADGGAPQLPPTLYCKEKRAYFVPPCPECGDPLQTCRDDILLAQNRLPTFGGSLERFLFCAACRAADRAVRFYSLIPIEEELRARAPVDEQQNLYEGFARLALSGGALPCAGCANVPTCYPAEEGQPGEVIRLITPLSFYDFRCLPLERFHLSYEEFAALLGGWRPTGESGMSGDSAPYAALDQGQRCYLFEDDPKGKLPLEVFRLKLMLFSQLATAASRLHCSTRLPHLGLSPRSAVVELGEPAAEVPSFYNFCTRLIDIGSAIPRRVHGLGENELAIALLDPPPLRDPTYAAAAASAPPVERQGSLSIKSVSEAPGGRYILEAELQSDSLEVETLGDKDLVGVSVRQARPLPLSVELFAYAANARGERVSLRSLPLPFKSDVVGQLRSLAGQSAVLATFRVHRCLHVPADMESLGLILFATLAGNAEQGAPGVVEAVRKLSAKLRRTAEETGDAGEKIEEMALEEIRQLEDAGVLARRQLFHRPAAHPDPGDQIPAALWHGALLLGLRALTQVGEFGFCRGHDDFDPQHPEGPADRLRGELGVLNHKIDAELLGRRGMRRVFSAALARIRQESGEGSARDGEGGWGTDVEQH